MRRSWIGAALVLGAVGSACHSGTDPIIDPVGPFPSITVTPDRARPGTAATVTWEGGAIALSVRLMHGRCDALPVYATVRPGACPNLVVVAENLPTSGHLDVTLGDSGHYCMFPVRIGGATEDGKCMLASIVP